MSPSPTTPPGEAREVLIAEDSPTQSLLLEGILQKNGFRVRACANGRLALAAFRERRPDLIISDIQMPEMDGYELCRQVKADPDGHAIPLILLTSLSAPQDIIHGLECGADNFVVKPYEEDFLLTRIRTVLANREMRSLAGDDSGGIPIWFAGERYVITSDRRQILNLLLSTYETAVKSNADLIKAHEELKAAQAQLIEAEKLQSVGRLAAGIAHEVRNPLAILEMGLGFLGDQSIGEDGHLILGEMKEAVRRANSVIVGLMQLAAPREMGMPEGDLNDVVERALAVMADAFDRAGIAVTRDLAADLPPAPVDAAKIEQAFINIFTNALHAMPSGGELAVASRVAILGLEEASFDPGDRSGGKFREGDSVIVIDVRDTGSGIAPENLGKVFEPFFSTKPTGQGMGLGLTVTRKIIDLHRGRIAVANHADGGVLVTTQFKIA